MTEYIPLIIAVLTTVVAILKHYGKAKHAKALQIVVDAVEKDGNQAVKDDVSTQTIEMKAIRAVIDSAVKKAK